MVDDAIKFRNELRDGYNTCFPLKRVRVRKIDIRKPWLDDEALKSKIKERNRLYALKLKGTHGLSFDSANQLGLLTSEIGTLKRDLKKSFFARQLNEAGKNSRAAWRVCMTSLGRLIRKAIPSVGHLV